MRVVLIILLFIQPALSQKSEMNEKQWFSGLKLRSIGPAITSGRISDLAVNPEKPWEYYVGVASGGIWKTNNSGITWTPIFDEQKSFSIGCITMDPNNHHVLWVGTGENNGQRSVSYGDGIYRSADGGENWTHLGLTNTKQIAKIIVDPTNSATVYVAAQGALWHDSEERGVYKTTDSGQSWQAVLTISPKTGVTDLIMDPRDPNVLYAAAYQRRRHVFTFVGGGPESAIYKTTNGGTSWTKLEQGLPTGDLGKIGLAVSPVDPDIVYAIIEASLDKGGFFRSKNRGASWEKQSDYVSMYPMYYQEIYADPYDAQTVYSMDTYSMVSSDGGKTFRRLGNQHRHVDDHALWIDPDNTNHLLIGGDGGIYETYDRGQRWHFKENLPVTQFYRVSVDNDTPFYNVYGGTQDNATLGGPSQTLSQSGILNCDWFITVGGDGFETQIDPENPDIVYSQWQNGNLIRYDRKSGEIMGIKPREAANEFPLRWNWDSPLIISPHQASRLYFAANRLFRSDDYGNTWNAVSGDLTRQINRDKLKVMDQLWGADAVARHGYTSFFGNIVALSESPLKEGLLLVGTDDGLIQISENSGQVWQKISEFPDVPEMSYVSSLFASQHDVNRIYATFYNHKNGDYKPYVLRSNELGKNWEHIDASLPHNGPVYTIIEDHVNPDLLFLGTEFGLFFTIDGGEHWIPLKNGLPPIAVRDIAIQQRENDLAIATFGRGFYILDDYSPLQNFKQTIDKKDAAIFPIKDALIYIQNRKGSGPRGATHFSAENPPFGATITYFLRESIKGSKQVRAESKSKQPIDSETLRAENREEEPFIVCSISDEAGDIIRNIRGPAKKGIHRITWDLRYTSPLPVEHSESTAPFTYNDGDLLAIPGPYFVSLYKYEKGTYTQIAGPEKFKTVSLNITTLPAEDREELVRFQDRLRKLRRAVLGTVSSVQEMQHQLQLMLHAATVSRKAPVELAAMIEKRQEELHQIERALSGDRFKRNLNENTPPSVVDRIQQIVGEQWRSTSAPTATQRQNAAIAEEMFGPILNQLHTLKAQINNINSQLDAGDAPWTPGRLPEWERK